MYDIKDSRAIITGSAQGFGKEFARRLLQNGFKVCLSDIDEQKGLETKSLFQKQFGLDDSSICFVKCDVSEKESWKILWDYAEKFLEGPIDILINNAGLNPMVILIHFVTCFCILPKIDRKIISGIYLIINDSNKQINDVGLQFQFYFSMDGKKI